MQGDYYKTKESVAEYIQLAKEVSGAKRIEKLAAHLRPQATVLELGSGPGTDWEILRSTYQVYGSDNSVEFLAHLQSNYPDGEFLNLDAATLQTNLRFDAIYSNKVMHHLRDKEFVASVKKQHECLNEHGIICHSFWKGQGHELFNGLFVQYYEKADLQQVLKPYFEILLLEEYAEFEAGDSLLLIGQKRKK